MVLDRITSLMKHIPSSSHKPTEAVEEKKAPALTDLVLEGTKLCGAFAHAVALIDKLSDGNEGTSSLFVPNQILTSCR